LSTEDYNKVTRDVLVNNQELLNLNNDIVMNIIEDQAKYNNKDTIKKYKDMFDNA
jgi:hypothetical protein